MKKIIALVLIATVSGFVGYLVGRNDGYQQGKSSTEFEYRFRNIDAIKAELKERENEEISKYISGNAGILNIDEGGLFKIKNVQYFRGELSNSATLATAKDVELNVDFYSKTGAKIGSQTLTVYEFIKPGESVKFKENINVSENVFDFKFQIINVKAE